MAKIKIRAKARGDSATVKTLMSHPMETGLRKDRKTGEPIPAHYISEVTCEHQGKAVMTAYLGPAVSKDPYLSFQVKGAAKGDTVRISWVDNKGETASADAEVK